MAKALCAIYAVWGFNWVMMKLANEYFSPMLFVTYRFASGAMVLLLASFMMRLSLPEKRFWPWIVLTGALQISLNSIIVQVCIDYLGAGLSAVLNYTMPIWVAILARFFLAERLTLKKIFGIFLSVAGLAVLLNIDVADNAGAVLLALCGALSWAAANVIYKLKLTECNMTVYNTWQMTVGAAILIAASLVTGQGGAVWTPFSVVCVLYNGVLASALAFFLWSYVLSRTEAGKAAVYILAVPAVGVLCGAIFLAEPLPPVKILGMALVLLGIVTVVHQKK